MAAKSYERTSMHARPARAVLVDVHSSVDAGRMAAIQEALSQAMTLFYHLKGPCRVAYFGLTVLEAFPEPIFPIQLLRNNFTRLQNAISEIKLFAPASNTHRMSSSSGCGDCIVEGIQEVIIQFQRVAQSFRQDSSMNFPSQLEVTLLTGRSQSTVQSIVDKSSGQLNVDCLSKIQVVCISGEAGVDGDGRELMGDEVEGECLDLNFTCSDISSSILDVCSVDCDTDAIVAILKHWLHETTGEQESLHIQLPTNELGQHVVLKCDVMECVLDPALLPVFQSHYSLKEPLGPTNTRSAPGQAQQGLLGQEEGVRVLQSVMLVPSEGVCESALLGLPLVLRPTSCWKLDWEELESNSQSFTALCKLLREQDRMLVVSESPTPLSSLSPRGHFLILPSPSPSPSSLLIKPIVVSELYLHNTIPVSYEEPSCDSMLSMEAVLNKVPQSKLYNPLEVHSGLYKSLEMISNRKAPTARGGRGGGVAGRGRSVTGRGGMAGRGRGVAGTVGSKRKSQVQHQMEELGTTSRSLGPKKNRVTDFVGSMPSSGPTPRHSSVFPPPSDDIFCDDFEE